MSRPRAALALFGVWTYLFAGSYACSLVFTRFGGIAYGAVFALYAVIGIWLVVLFGRAVRS